MTRPGFRNLIGLTICHLNVCVNVLDNLARRSVIGQRGRGSLTERGFCVEELDRKLQSTG